VKKNFSRKGKKMKIHLHKNATTTPAHRAFIQNNPDLSVAHLAEKIGVSKTTIQRWRKRSNVFDRPHTPNCVNKALSPMDEVKIIICRLATRAGLDDLHKIVESFLGIACSRASLNRCLKRYHISKLPVLGHAVPYDLKDYSGTYLYYTCFQMTGLFGHASPVCLHTLLDCSFRSVNAELSVDGSKFLSRHIREFPLRVLGILYQDPIVLTPGADSPVFDHPGMMVETLCRSHKIIAHRLETQYPQTIQKLNETCASFTNTERIVPRTFSWSSNAEFASHIDRYNTRFTLGSLKQQTPRQALKNHHAHFPNSFRKKPEVWA
jgi:hypothetical protein